MFGLLGAGYIRALVFLVLDAGHIRVLSMTGTRLLGSGGFGHFGGLYKVAELQRVGVVCHSARFFDLLAEGCPRGRSRICLTPKPFAFRTSCGAFGMQM